MFNLLGLTQWVLEPTFISSGNILDLVLTTEADRILHVETHPPFPRCGHVVVYFEYIFQMQMPDAEISCANFLRAADKKSYSWSKGNYQKIKESLNEIDWDFKFCYQSVNDMY